jgi:mono/diheme cytochrome c family protein
MSPRIPLGLLRTFAGLSLALFAVGVWAVVDETRAEWRVWQSRFEELTGAGEESGEEERGIRQVWLPDLDRVDRCTSCHLGIADPGMGDAEQPFRAHGGAWLETHRPDRFGCTSCHAGRGEATTWAGAAHEPQPNWREPMASRELMEARCGTCHRERQPRGTWWLARGRELMADRNCVACHEVPGHREDEVRAPRLDGLARKVGPGWLRAWLGDPTKYLERSRMGNFRLAPEEVEALTAFLLEPHGEVVLEEVDWSGASAERGGEVFRGARCVTCHSLDGRGGTLAPELGRIGAKASRDWLYSWIRDPHRHQPGTLMPRFRFSDDEVRDLATYLAEDLGDPGELELDASAPGRSLVGEGRRIYERRGCHSCHELTGFPERPRIGPKLEDAGDLVFEPAPLQARGVRATVPNYLFTKVSAPEQVLESARMPTFGFSEPEAAAVAVALLSLRTDPLPEARVTRDPELPPYEPQGEFGDLVRRYRCLSCHQIQGTGGTLSTVALDRIGSQLRREHIEQYLQKPIAVRVGLQERMPHLNIASGEARVLADFLSTVMLDDALEGEIPSDPETVARGKELFEGHGCVGCHIVGNAGGYVGPELNGSGARLKPGWTVAWLLDPERWKPGTLQPDHGLSREEAEALTAYTLSLPARRGRGAQ